MQLPGIAKSRGKKKPYKNPRLIKSQDLPMITDQISKPEIGIVIGNGSSRRGYDLTRLDGLGLTVGCNYVYHDYTPDYVVAIDDYIVDDIKEHLRQNPAPDWKFMCRTYLDGRFWWLCADGDNGQVRVCRFATINHRLNQDTGLLGAYFLANTMQIETVYLIGIDFYQQVPDEINDIYHENLPEKPGIERAWNVLVNDHPKTRFVRVGKIHDEHREYFSRLKGIEFLESFDDMECKQ